MRVRTRVGVVESGERGNGLKHKVNSVWEGGEQVGVTNL